MHMRTAAPGAFFIPQPKTPATGPDLSGVGPRGPGEGRGFGPVQPAYLPGGQAAFGRLGQAGERPNPQFASFF